MTYPPLAVVHFEFHTYFIDLTLRASKETILTKCIHSVTICSLVFKS